MKLKGKFVSNIFDSLFKIKKAIQLFNTLGYLEKRIANLEMHVPMLTNQTIERIQHLSRLLQPIHVDLNLVRVGINGDGGYVISTPKRESLVLSLGVGNEISADIQLIEVYGSEIYAFDPFVPRPNVKYTQFNFFQIGCRNDFRNKENLEFKTLEEILKMLPRIPDLAFIDIEGDEWKIGQKISLLSSVSQIVIEFHNLQRLVDNEFYTEVVTLLDTILKSHIPIHVHANNSGPTVPVGGASWPGIMEVTFFKKHLIPNFEPIPNYGPWPTKLCFPNSLDRPDINLEPFFGRDAFFRAE
jgi:hypothetical protein